MRKLVIVFISFLCFIACWEEEKIFPPEIVVTPPDTTSNLTGFYLLNEGIMVHPVTKDIYLYRRLQPRLSRRILRCLRDKNRDAEN
jgi:uridine kinase